MRQEKAMCGRYYVDDETVREIEKLVKEISSKAKLSGLRKDIHPADEAPILLRENNSLKISWQHWGFPGFQGKGVIFNARSETALEKKMFRDSVLHWRIIVPCTWFYEWNHAKEKVTCLRDDSKVMYLAGFYKHFGEEDRFVILTTAANESMKSIHERMPLMLEREEIADWVMDDGKAEKILHQVPGKIKKKVEYEQQCMF